MRVALPGVKLMTEKRGGSMRKSKADWSMREWRDYYNKLQDKAYQNYQETGIARYDREFIRYERIVDAFNGYLENKNDQDTERTRRIQNISAYVDKYVHHNSYTRDEVLKMIRDISTF